MELLIPLHRPSDSARDHLGPSLALMFVTFATNLFLNVGLLPVLTSLQPLRLGENLIRRGFLAVFAIGLGAKPRSVRRSSIVVRAGGLLERATFVCRAGSIARCWCSSRRRTTKITIRAVAIMSIATTATSPRCGTDCSHIHTFYVRNRHPLWLRRHRRPYHADDARVVRTAVPRRRALGVDSARRASLSRFAA